MMAGFGETGALEAKGDGEGVEEEGEEREIMGELRWRETWGGKGVRKRRREEKKRKKKRKKKR